MPVATPNILLVRLHLLLGTGSLFSTSGIFTLFWQSSLTRLRRETWHSLRGWETRWISPTIYNMAPPIVLSSITVKLPPILSQLSDCLLTAVLLRPVFPFVLRYFHFRNIYLPTTECVFVILTFPFFLLYIFPNVHSRGRRGLHIGYWWESQKERDHWEDQDVGGWTILKWILDRMGWCGLDWYGSG
jgi:hypothetical protein